MMGIFSWKERSAEIFKIISDEMNSRHIDTDDDDDDFDDIKTADRTAFEESSLQRQKTLKLNPDKDWRLQKWRELTNIETTPTLPPRRTPSFCYSAQRLMNQRLNTGNKVPHVQLECPEKFYKELPQQQNGASILSFKFQYLIITERLKVTIEHATNLFKDAKNESSIVANAKVCLMPGKTQQQFTSIVKGTKSPVFETVFFFTGFSLHDIHQMCLRVKVNGRQGKYGALKTLGEVSVCLDDFDLIGETHIEESLNTRVMSKNTKR